jgi:hypothetical protein
MSYIVWRSGSTNGFKMIQNGLGTITELVGYLNYQAKKDNNIVFKFSTQPEGEKVKLKTILDMLGYKISTAYTEGFINFYHPSSGDRIMIGKEIFELCNK